MLQIISSADSKLNCRKFVKHKMAAPSQKSFSSGEPTSTTLTSYLLSHEYRKILLLFTMKIFTKVPNFERKNNKSTK